MTKQKTTIPRMTLRELLDYARDIKDTLSVEDFTCWDCSSWQKCEYAFDIYNLYDDCLFEINEDNSR